MGQEGNHLMSEATPLGDAPTFDAPTDVTVTDSEGVEHSLTVSLFRSGAHSVGAAQCSVKGCRYYQSLAEGVTAPPDLAARFRVQHQVAEPGDVAEMTALEALGKAIEAASELADLAAGIAKKLSDPDERLRTAGWWDDHNQGLSYTARTVEARLQVYLAHLNTAHTERAIADRDT